MAVTLKIQWIKSTIGYRKDQADTIRSLGFRKLNQTVERPDTKVFRGMIHKVRHLVRVTEEEDAP